MAWLSNSFANRPVSGSGGGWLSQKFKQQAKATAQKYQQGSSQKTGLVSDKFTQQARATGEKFRQRTVNENQLERWQNGDTRVTPMDYKWKASQTAYTRALGAYVRAIKDRGNHGEPPPRIKASGDDVAYYGGNGGGDWYDGGGYTPSTYIDPFYLDMMKWII